MMPSFTSMGRSLKTGTLSMQYPWLQLWHVQEQLFIYSSSAGLLVVPGTIYAVIKGISDG